LAEASQAMAYVLGFRTKPYVFLVQMAAQQSVTAKALPLIQEFTFLVDGSSLGWPQDLCF
jgi:hypothetical protein